MKGDIKAPGPELKKIVSRHKTVYLCKTKCYVLMSRLQKHILAISQIDFIPVQTNIIETTVPARAEFGPVPTCNILIVVLLLN